MRCLGLALALFLWLGASAARAADDAELATWRERLDTAQAELTSAQQRSTAAEAAYAHMRHEPSIRGDEKGKIIAERGDAKQAVAAAQAQLAEVREAARRAGAPLEWVLPNPSDAPADEPSDEP